MPKYDVSELLYNRFENDRFINKLEVSDPRVTAMKAARTKVRNAIKSAFTLAKNNQGYLSRMSADEREAFISIEPRFWPQGSLAYGTQNMPIHIPPQQIDVDDGVYLPIEALRERPVVFKEVFFEIVDNALQMLAEKERWIFIGDKNTCVRLELNPLIHLDVPLYAIPLDRFDELQKAMGRVAFNREGVEIDDDFNLRRVLGEQEVYLALRESPHWKLSDPIRIQEWFEHEQDLFGGVFTRTCRYLKAWRDYQWAKGGPSSITLMICVWETFKESEKKFYTDSEALLAVCRQLPEQLRTGVPNPVAPEETVFPRDIDDETLKMILERAHDFSLQVSGVIERGASAIDVVITMRDQWGDRIPHRADWVISAAAAAASVVTSTPASSQTKPDVGTMRSGSGLRSV